MNLPDAEHRSHRRGRRELHRLLRATKLHRWSCRLYQRQRPRSLRHDQVGLPGAKEGWERPWTARWPWSRSQGYATGQFGKNHQGDLDEHLPTMHGFDEFFGSLYHLNANEEPENEDYPKDEAFHKKYGPRGVLRCKADGKGGQTIEDTGPLNIKRMETIDDEVTAAAKDFITRQAKAGQPFFCWWNASRMHFRTHVKAEHRGISGQDEYSDGMVEHDMHVGELLKLIDDLGLANDTIVQYSTDNGPHYNTWPDGGTSQFRSEKNSNWEGAYRVSVLHALAEPSGRHHAQWHRFPRGLVPHLCCHSGCSGHQGKAAGGRGPRWPSLSATTLMAMNQQARLPDWQGEGITAQPVRLRQRRRRDCRHAYG